MQTQNIIECIAETNKKCAGPNEKLGSAKKRYGDVCVRVFAHYIKQSPRAAAYDVSEPNAYIAGFSTEFDLLLIKNGTKPIEHTNCYFPEDVKCGIECKAHGLFGGNDILPSVIDRIRTNFENVRNKHPDINFAYITLEEVTDQSAKTVHYFSVTERILGCFNFKAFCLRDSRTKSIRIGEWDRFIDEITK